MKRLPNIISLLRILVVPVVIWLVVADYWSAAFWIFLAAGISDAVDGFIAKRFDAVTKVGIYLDPLADKILLVAVFATFGASGLMPLWLVVLVVSRDVLIVGGVLFSVALSLPVTVRTSALSKANTFAQMALAAIVLAANGVIWPLDVVVELMTYVVGVLTAVSGGHYVMQWSGAAFHDSAGA